MWWIQGIGIAAILCVFTAGTVRKQRMSESLPLEVDSVQLLFSVPLKQYWAISFPLPQSWLHRWRRGNSEPLSLNIIDTVMKLRVSSFLCHTNPGTQKRGICRGQLLFLSLCGQRATSIRTLFYRVSRRTQRHTCSQSTSRICALNLSAFVSLVVCHKVYFQIYRKWQCSASAQSWCHGK